MTTRPTIVLRKGGSGLVIRPSAVERAEDGQEEEEIEKARREGLVLRPAPTNPQVMRWQAPLAPGPVVNVRPADRATPASRGLMDLLHPYTPTVAPAKPGEEGRPAPPDYTVLNPYTGRTGRIGGELWRVGRNGAGDAIITHGEGAGRHVLLIQRPSGQWALPGGFENADGEHPITTVFRELQEESGARVSAKGHRVVYIGHVRDPRETDDRWVETTAAHKHLTPAQARRVKLKAGDDARKAEWVRLDDPRIADLYASHRDILQHAVGELPTPLVALDLSVAQVHDDRVGRNAATRKAVAEMFLGPGTTWERLKSVAVGWTGLTQEQIRGSHISIGILSSDTKGDYGSEIRVSVNGAAGFSLSRRYIVERSLRDWMVDPAPGERRPLRKMRYAKHDSAHNDGERRSGHGTLMLARAADRLRAAGFDVISTQAAGYGPKSDIGLRSKITPENSSFTSGYYAWPRMGYDAELGDDERRLALKLLPKGQKRPKKLSDLMKTPEGRQFWFDYGHGKTLNFDLREGSLSQRIMAEYLAEKGLTKGETIELDEEDEAILDRIWDRIGREERGELTEEDFAKANREGLVPVKRTVSRGGRSFEQTFWVRPEEARDEASGFAAELSKREARIASLHHEQAHLWIAEQKQWQVVRGRDNEVRIPGIVIARARIDGNAVLTHNHPPSRTGEDPLWLSPEDIHTAVDADLKEIRAVSGGHVWVLARPDGGWPIGSWTRHDRLARRAAASKVMDLHEEAENRAIDWMIDYCNERGFEYSRISQWGDDYNALTGLSLRKEFEFFNQALQEHGYGAIRCIDRVTGRELDAGRKAKGRFGEEATEEIAVRGPPIVYPEVTKAHPNRNLVARRQTVHRGGRSFEQTFWVRVPPFDLKRDVTYRDGKAYVHGDREVVQQPDETFEEAAAGAYYAWYPSDEGVRPPPRPKAPSAHELRGLVDPLYPELRSLTLYSGPPLPPLPPDVERSLWLNPNAFVQAAYLASLLGRAPSPYPGAPERERPLVYDQPHLRPALEAYALALGMRPIGEVGAVVPFDGIRHHLGLCDPSADVWPDDPVEIVHRGWGAATANGPGFARVGARAEVRVSAVNKAAIAGRPGLQLLPAPSNPRLMRWQRVLKRTAGPLDLARTELTALDEDHLAEGQEKAMSFAFLGREDAPWSEVCSHLVHWSGLSQEDLAGSMLTAHPGPLPQHGFGSYSVKFEYLGPEFSMHWTVSSDLEGVKRIYVQNVSLHPWVERGTGRAIAVLPEMLQRASGAGVQEVSAWAGGRGTHLLGTASPRVNGYYTWPRLGFDGALPEGWATPEGGPPAPASVRNATRISEVLSSSVGRAWWKRWGQPIHVAFDLRPNSSSWVVLTAYLRGKGLMKGVVAEDRLELVEEALLDRIWDQIGSGLLLKALPPGYSAIPNPRHRHDGGRKPVVRGGKIVGFTYWYPEQHPAPRRGQRVEVDDVRTHADLKPGDLVQVAGLDGTWRYTPDHDPDETPEGHTWVTTLVGGEHVLVKKDTLFPVRLAVGRQIKSGKREKLKVFEGSRARPGTILHKLENGAYYTITGKVLAVGRNTKGVEIPPEDMPAFLDEFEDLLTGAVSYVARRVRWTLHGKTDPRSEDLLSAARMGLVLALRSYSGGSPWLLHAKRYARTYAFLAARSESGFTEDTRRLLIGFNVALTRARARFHTDNPRPEKIAEVWAVSKRVAYAGTLRDYVDPESGKLVRQNDEELPDGEWQVRDADGHPFGRVLPGKVKLAESLLNLLDSGANVRDMDWLLVNQEQIAPGTWGSEELSFSEQEAMEMRLETVLGRLSDLQRRALELRYATEGDQPLAYEWIADELGIAPGASIVTKRRQAKDLVLGAETVARRVVAELEAASAEYRRRRYGGESERAEFVPAHESLTALTSRFGSLESAQAYLACTRAGKGAEAAAILDAEARGQAAVPDMLQVRRWASDQRDRERFEAFRRHAETRVVDPSPSPERGPDGERIPNGLGPLALDGLSTGSLLDLVTMHSRGRIAVERVEDGKVVVTWRDAGEDLAGGTGAPSNASTVRREDVDPAWSPARLHQAQQAHARQQATVAIEKLPDDSPFGDRVKHLARHLSMVVPDPTGAPPQPGEAAVDRVRLVPGPPTIAQVYDAFRSAYPAEVNGLAQFKQRLLDEGVTLLPAAPDGLDPYQATRSETAGNHLIAKALRRALGLPEGR